VRAPPPLSEEERAALQALATAELEPIRGFSARLRPRGMPGSEEARDCGMPSAVGLSWVGGGEQVEAREGRAEYAISHCSAFFEELRRRRGREIGAAPYRIHLSPGMVTAGETVLFNLADDCQELLEKDGSCHGDGIWLDWSVLSLVGPILSLGVHRSEARGGGPMYHRERWNTLDLRTNRPAELSALIPESALVSAFAHAPALLRSLLPEAQARLARAQTLEEIWSIWAPPGRDEFGAYAFALPTGGAGPTPGPGEELLRFGFRYFTMGLSPNHLNVLDREVVPRPEAREWFERARRGEGVLSPWDDRTSDGGWE